MTEHYRRGYSGNNYDRWVASNTNTTALGKVQKQFWFTKSAVLRKFGKKEDEYIAASDAELDAKIELFKAIESSTKELQLLLADYQTRICVLAQEENSLGRLLKEFGKQDQTRAGKMMNAVGKTLSYTAQQRVGLRSPLVRLFQDIDTFQTRAIEDTADTVEEVEKVRTEYRGALMWMKNISQDFNPDQYQQLEKFREVQNLVKQRKGRFDQIKIKVLQKIELLAASRCNMFSHALTLYQNNMITFSEKTAKALSSVASNFKGYEPYKFQVIKELADLPVPDDEDGKESTSNKEEESIFSAEFFDEDNKKENGRDPFNLQRNKSNDSKSNAEMKKQQSDSLMNLLTEETDQTLSFGDDSNLLLLQNMEERSKALAADPFADIDLLSDDYTSHTNTSNSDILRELFDSPSSLKSPEQQLPVFGNVISAPNSGSCKAGQSEVNSGKGGPNLSSSSQQPFLPSHLLDFGFREMESFTQQTSSAPSPSSSSTLLPKTRLNSQTQHSVTAPQNSTLTSNPNPVTEKLPSKAGCLKKSTVPKGDASKLDWFKVFQDIDPLSDPASAIFGKDFDEKKC